MISVINSTAVMTSNTMPMINWNGRKYSRMMLHVVWISSKRISRRLSKLYRTVR